MTMKLSPTQIKEIAERAEKATEERWYLWEGEGGVKAMYPFVGCADDGSGLDVVFTCDHDEGCDRDEERAFFVKSAKAAIQARQDIPALLAHIAAQDGERKEINSLLMRELTPGGSEFHDDPRACIEFAKKRMNSFSMSKLAELKAQIANLERERDEARARIAQLESQIAMKDGALKWDIEHCLQCCGTGREAHREVLGSIPFDCLYCAKAREALKGSAK